MAIGSTIYKVSLSIADMDRHLYDTFDLTIAKHPSETPLRMMIRIIAFTLQADERLTFTKGLSQEDEPELWWKDFGGDIELWIELGQADEKRIRKACGRSKSVIVYTYNQNAAASWLRENEVKFKRFKNLELVHLELDKDPIPMIERSMKFQANIQDGELQLMDDENTLSVTPSRW